MTRRDYVRIAAALAEARRRAERIAADPRERIDPFGAPFGVQLATEALAEMLAADNPRFDADRFTRAAEAQS